ncbi:uncharacterized protein LOC117106223, partial [Anneissia japonica]|uniref:uncharacterized protein LOC117106223 n=1 Tax=Anneissia japonica TaxID=1529436 RepID=UPI00142590F2
NVFVNTEEDFRLNPARYSKWNKLVRIEGYVMRFIINCRKSCESRKCGELDPEEFMDAEKLIIKAAQQEAFNEEIKKIKKRQNLSVNNVLIALNPKLDDDGLLRSSGRLDLNESLPYDVRNPIILPRKHQVTKLIVKKYHELGHHVAGTNHTLALLSERFWIISAREEIREYEEHCNECKRRKAKGGEQIMAPLPKFRSNMDNMRAFHRVAVDYAGPFLTRQGRGKTKIKRYLCLFTCVATRAVHLEMAYGLDTDTFLNAFYRFVGRRGMPKQVISDNGTNFVGANRELSELIKSVNKDKIQQTITDKGVSWKFIPPSARHFGGVHE